MRNTEPVLIYVIQIISEHLLCIGPVSGTKLTSLRFPSLSWKKKKKARLLLSLLASSVSEAENQIKVL